MRFCIHTFGCQMNENDSRLISALLIADGHRQVDSPDEAEIIIVNTCCVRESAENRALGYLGSLKKYKETDPSRIIAVCGCMIQKKDTAEKLLRSYRHVGIIIGTFSAALLPSYIAEYAATGRTIVDVEERYDGNELCRCDELPVTIESGYRAQVNINYGCNNFCTYCIVPYVRGRERSRRPEEIIEEISRLAQAGVKEIQLLGQNVNSYGKNLPIKTSFADLLTLVNDITGIERIRFMTSHPRDFNRQLVERIASLNKVCHQFHLPIQSGCDRLLQQMNRGYTADEYRRHLQDIRELFSDATVTTDLIIGFPGETEDDFQQTLDFLCEARFDAAYTFIYSRRSGTPAADMPNQIADAVKHERLQRLMDVQNAISLELNEAQLGRIMPVMVEGASKTDPAMFSGRTDGNKIVVFSAAGLRPGQTVPLRITAAKTWNLVGEIIE